MTETLQLFIAPGCPHCPNMIKTTTELVKQGEIGQLEIINLAVAGEAFVELNIKSVPTCRFQGLLLSGVHSAAELLEWMTASSSETGLIDFFNRQFEQGNLEEILHQVVNKPELLGTLLEMSGDFATPLTSRIGISAIFESFQNTHSIVDLMPRIIELSKVDHESTRADMAYFLGLSGDASALPQLEKLLQDKFADVSEVAADAIDMIKENSKRP